MNELDKKLCAELNPFNFNEQRIRELVAAGANVNAIGENGEPIAFRAIEVEYDENQTDHLGDLVTISEDDPSLIKLLLELGLEIEIVDDLGFTILYQAYMNALPKTVEALLKAGASPNIICDEEILETIYTDAAVRADYKESLKNNESPTDPYNKYVENLKQIVKLMKQYGGAGAWEVYTNKVEGFLRITSLEYYPTGLITRRGMIKYSDIQDSEYKFAKRWFNFFRNTERDKGATEEVRYVCQKYLALQFKKILPPEIKIYTDELLPRVD